MEVYRQRITIEIVWAEPSEQDPKKVDWQSELAQALNEANGYCGTIWQMDQGPLEKLGCSTP